MRSIRLGLLAIVSLSGWAAVPAEEPAEDGKMRCVRRIEEAGKRLFEPTFSADGRLLVATDTAAVYLWDAATGKTIRRFEQSTEICRSAVSPDGRTLAFVTRNAKTGAANTLVLLDAKSGQVQHTLQHDIDVGQFAFAPDGNTLISAGDRDRAVRLWNTATGQEIRRMRLKDRFTGKELDPKRVTQPSDRDSCSVAVFSPDGKTVALGLEDASVRLCDPSTGEETRRLYQEGFGNVGVLAFSPNGRLLAAGSGFHDFVQLWDVTSGQVVREFPPPI